MKNIQRIARVTLEDLEKRVLMAVDLTMSASIHGQMFQPGDTVPATIVLVNHGKDPAGAFDVSLALSESGVFGDADNVALATIPETGPDAHSRIVMKNVMLTIPGGAAVGEYHLVGKVDSGDTVAESNEKNNTVHLRKVVQVGAVVSIIARPTTTTPAGPPVQFTVTRTGDSLSMPLVVNYSVTGTGVAGTDFTALPGTVTIAAGRRSAVITLTPISGNVISMSNKSVTITVDPGTDYNVALGKRASDTVIINNSGFVNNAALVLVPGTTTSTLLVVPLEPRLSNTDSLTTLTTPVTFPAGTPVATVPFVATSFDQVGFINFQGFGTLSTPLVMSAGTDFSFASVSSLSPALISPLGFTPVGNTGLTPAVVTSSLFSTLPITTVANPAALSSPLLPPDLSSSQMDVPVPFFP